MSELDEAEYTMQHVFHINGHIPGAFVASSGKDMGAFKGVGYPEDIGEFYRIGDYKAWAWTAHGRFPTNTPGWWAARTPSRCSTGPSFTTGRSRATTPTAATWSSSATNASCKPTPRLSPTCSYLLITRHGFSQEMAAHIMTANAWDEIDRMDPERARFETALRIAYSSALVNGPLSVILGSDEGLLALNDRLKLRALMAARRAAWCIWQASRRP